MTHGGLLGSSEAAYCGVPVVSTPFYGDQFLNSAALQSRGMAVILPYKDINKDSVFIALRKALDPKLKKNAKKVAYSYTHRPMTPVETAVYWTEYVIATGGAELVQPHAVHAHWLIYTGLDIILFVLAVLLVTIASWIYLLKKLCKSKAPQPPKGNNHSRAASIEKKFK